MKNIYLNGILFVEGKEDKAFLSNYIKSPIFILNGVDQSSKSIIFARKYHKKIDLFLLADPDEAGGKIKEYFNREGVKIIVIEPENITFVRGKKHGIAEADFSSIQSAISPFINQNYEDCSHDYGFLYETGLVGDLDSRNKRKYICEKLELPILNGKDFKTILKILELDKDKVIELLKDYGN